jgi:hypothetical protein
MRYNGCQKYFDIYVDNDNVSLIIYQDKTQEIENSLKLYGEVRYKIRGRAILWKLSRLDGKPTDKLFMDRIYTDMDNEQYLFIDYAKENKWLYKAVQAYGREYKIIDPEDNTSEHRLMEVDTKKDEYSYYPYVDTLSHFENSTLDNDNDVTSGYSLNETNGSFEDLDGDYVWSEYHQRSLRQDEATWCEYDNDYCEEGDAIYLDTHHCYCTPNTNTFEYRNDIYPEDDGVWDDYNDCTIPESYSVYCDEENKTIHQDDVIELEYRDGYFTPDADFVSDTVNDRQLYQDDAVWSNTQNSYIVKDDAIEIYINEDDDTDWIYEDNKDDYCEEKNGKYYLKSYLESIEDEEDENNDNEEDNIKENYKNDKNDIFLKIYNFEDFNKINNK